MTEPTLIEHHLDKARNELILAYNTAKNAGLPDSKTAIAWMLADVSAELQYHNMRTKGPDELDVEHPNTNGNSQ